MAFSVVIAVIGQTWKKKFIDAFVCEKSIEARQWPWRAFYIGFEMLILLSPFSLSLSVFHSRGVMPLMQYEREKERE